MCERVVSLDAFTYVTGAGRLAPPPAPPTRSPSTELSNRIPPPPPPPPLPPSSMRNGHLHSLDDFESKFQFHPVEDFPPPEEFRPFPRVYPSKEHRVPPKPPAIRTHLRWAPHRPELSDRRRVHSQHLCVCNSVGLWNRVWLFALWNVLNVDVGSSLLIRLQSQPDRTDMVKYVHVLWFTISKCF